MTLPVKKLIENNLSQLSAELAVQTRSFLDVKDYFCPQHSPRQTTILPIEHLRWHQLQIDQPAKNFISSGTTSSQRSLSPYSTAGLLLYQCAALATFDKLMEIMLSPQWYEFQGLSLIPNTAEWPDSSLAQMVAWIAEIAKLRYVSEASLPNLINSLEAARPVWIFGTGVHFMNLLQSNASPLPLPRGSLIIETGGSKGKTLELPRDVYFHRLAQQFQITEEQIISEYGMCELASQAYDFCPPHQPKIERYFRFPHWVHTNVETVEGICDQGEGCLVIDDPFRCDFGLRALRVQDYVSLNRDGSFRLNGRLQGAPLKGCSLNAEEIFRTSEVAKSRTPKPAPPTSLTPPTLTDREITAFAQALRTFLSSATTVAALAQETGSLNDAQYILDQTISCLPSSTGNWRQALARSVSATTPERWLLIAPRSHSLAVLYPVCFASLLGIKLTLRRPKPKAETPFLNEVIAFAAAHSLGSVSILDADFWIDGHKDALDSIADAICCFGSNETLAQISQLTNLPVKGWGSRLNYGVISFQDLSESPSEVVRDAFSLGQQGCVNLRFLAITSVGTRPVEPVIEKLTTSFAGYWGKSLTMRQQLALQHEAKRFLTLFPDSLQDSRPKGSSALFPVIKKESITPNLISNCPLALPVILFDDAKIDEVETLIQKQITGASNLYRNCKFGGAQRIIWDGNHERQPLFTTA